MKKRIFSILLAFCMVFGMMTVPVFASETTGGAAGEAGPPIPATATVWVGGVELSDGDYLAVGGTETTKTEPTTGYAYYKDGVLILNNYSYEGVGVMYDTDDYYYATVYSASDLEIVLVGKNSLTQTEEDSDGITAEADITVSGTGTLNITAAYGIYTYGDNVSIAGGNVKINAEYDGIASDGSVSITDGNVGLSASYGIYCNTVQITDSNVAIDAEYYTIYAYNSLEVVDASFLLPGIPEDGEAIALLNDGYSDFYTVVNADGAVATSVVLSDGGHKWSEEYAFNVDSHWLPCTDEDCLFGTYRIYDDTHGDNDENGFCDACGYNTGKEAQIIVSDLGLAEGEYLGNDGAFYTEAPEDMGYAHYAGGVLTLHDFVGRGTVYDAVHGYGAVTLKLEGENSLTCLTKDKDGVLIQGDLTVIGDGSLTVISEDEGLCAVEKEDEESGESSGGNITIESGTLNITTIDDDGLDAKKLLTVNGGNITIDADDYGIECDLDVVINGGELTITADDDGIDSVFITVNGGTLNIASDDNGLDAGAIYDTETGAYIGGGDITVNGGTLNITAGNNGLESSGIVTVNGGILYVVSKQDQPYNAAIAAYNAGGAANGLVIGDGVLINNALAAGRIGSYTYYSESDEIEYTISTVLADGVPAAELEICVCEHTNKILKNDDASHWYFCETCKMVLDKEAHFDGEDNNHRCDGCKYENEIEGHTPAEDDGDCTTDIHCTVCGGVAEEGAMTHSVVTLDDGSMVCSVCGGEYHPFDDNKYFVIDEDIFNSAVDTVLDGAESLIDGALGYIADQAEKAIQSALEYAYEGLSDLFRSLLSGF